MRQEFIQQSAAFALSGIARIDVSPESAATQAKRTAEALADLLGIQDTAPDNGNSNGNSNGNANPNG